MKIALSVPEFLEICKEVKKKPESIFKMLRGELRKSMGQYLSEMIRMELTNYLGRGPYERKSDTVNHRNGYYHRQITLKKIGSVDV